MARTAGIKAHFLVIFLKVVLKHIGVLSQLRFLCSKHAVTLCLSAAQSTVILWISLCGGIVFNVWLLYFSSPGSSEGSLSFTM